MITKQQLLEVIETIEDECFQYADDMIQKTETYSFGSGIRSGSMLALKHIKGLLEGVEE